MDGCRCTQYPHSLLFTCSFVLDCCHCYQCQANQKTHERLERTLFNQTKQNRMRMFEEIPYEQYENKQITYLSPVGFLQKEVCLRFCFSVPDMGTYSPLMRSITFSCFTPNQVMQAAAAGHMLVKNIFDNFLVF